MWTMPRPRQASGLAVNSTDLCEVVRLVVRERDWLPGSVRIIESQVGPGDRWMWRLLVDVDYDVWLDDLAHGRHDHDRDTVVFSFDPRSTIHLDKYAAVDAVIAALDRCIENTRADRATAAKRALLFPEWSPYP
jgi:hypothetical protein